LSTNGRWIPAVLQMAMIAIRVISQIEIRGVADVNLDIFGDNRKTIY
jgi:hypothetical protein